MVLTEAHKVMLMTMAFVALGTAAYIHVVDRDPEAARRVFMRVTGIGIAFMAMWTAWSAWATARDMPEPLMDEPFPLVASAVTNPPPLAFSG